MQVPPYVRFLGSMSFQLNWPMSKKLNEMAGNIEDTGSVEVTKKFYALTLKSFYKDSSYYARWLGDMLGKKVFYAKPTSRSLRSTKKGSTGNSLIVRVGTLKKYDPTWIDVLASQSSILPGVEGTAAWLGMSPALTVEDYRTGKNQRIDVPVIPWHEYPLPQVPATFGKGGGPLRKG